MSVVSVTTPTITPGRTGPVTVTLTNEGPTYSPPAQLDYEPPPGATVHAAATTGCTIGPRGSRLTCPIGTISVGASAVVNLTVALSAGVTGAPGPTVRPAGVRVVAERDPDGSNNVADAAVGIGPRSVAVGLRAEDAVLVPGRTGTVEVGIANAGPSDGAGSGIIELLAPPGFTLGGPVPSPPGLSCRPGAEPVIASCEFSPAVPLAAGESQNFGIPLRAPGNQPPGAVPAVARLRLLAGLDIEPLSQELTLWIADGAADVSAQVTRPHARPGRSAAFEIAALNEGPSDAPGSTVVFSLPAGAEFESGGPGCRHDAGVVTCTSGPVPVSGRAAHTVTARALFSSDPPSGSVVATSPLADPHPLDNRIEPTPLDLVAVDDDVRVTTNSPLRLQPGVWTTVNLAVANNGPSVAADPTVTWTPPSGFPLELDTPGHPLPLGCRRGPDSRTVSCSVPSGLGPGTRVFAIPARAAPDAPAVRVDGGSVTVESANDSDPAGNTAAIVGEVSRPRVDESAHVSRPAIVPGTHSTVMLRVANAGPSRSQITVLVYDLPPGLTPAGPQPTGCSPTDRTVTCAVPGLDPGTSAVFGIGVDLDSGAAPGEVTGGRVVATLAPGDVDPANNTVDSTRYTVLPPQADLAVTVRSFTLAPGETGTLAVRVANEGPSAGPGATVTITLPAPPGAVVSLAGGLPTGDATCGPGPPITCTLATALIPGEGLDLALPVSIPPDASPGIYTDGLAVVSSPTTDPVPSNDDYAVTFTVTPPRADLAITTTAPAIPPGGTGAVTVTSVNHGPSVAENVTGVVALPAGLTVDPSAPLAEGCVVPDAALITCTSAGPRGAGDAQELSVPVRLPPDVPVGPLTGGLAYVTATTGDPDGANNNVPLAPVASPPRHDIEVTVIAPPPISPGAEGVITASVINHGPADATDVDITIGLPAGLTMSETPPCTVTSTTATCRYPRLPAGSSGSVETSVAVAPTAEPGAPLVMAVSVASSSPELSPDPRPNSFGAPIAVGPAVADLNWSKSASVIPPDAILNPGDPFAYIIRITNQGPSAARNVVATDVLPGPISFVSSPDGCTAAGQDVRCVVDAGALAPGVPVTRRLIVRLDPGYRGSGAELGNTVQLSTDTPPHELDPTPAPSPTPPPAVGPAEVDLEWSTTAALPSGDDTVNPGDRFTYTVALTNHGPSDAVPLRISAELPGGLSFLESAHGCTNAGQRVSCDRDRLRPGTEAFSFTVALAPDYAGTGEALQTNTAVQTATKLVAPDPSPPPAEPAALPAPLGPPVADLAWSKTAALIAPDTQLNAGEQFTYTVSVANFGPSDAANVRISDPLPAALTFTGSASGCTAGGIDGRVVSCPPIAVLAPLPPTPAVPPVPVTYTFTVRLDPAFTGPADDLGNRAVVLSDTAAVEPDPHPPPEPTAPPGLGPPVADLEWSARADLLSGDPVLNPGDRFTNTVTVTNHGPSVAAAVEVVDDLSPGLTFAGGDGCAADPRRVACAIGAVAPGDSASLTITVQLSPSYTGDGGDLTTSPAVRSATAEPVPDPHPAAQDPMPLPAAVGPPLADLTWATTAALGEGDTELNPGDQFTYTVSVTNDGPSDATGVVALDSLPPPVTFVSSPAGCTAEGGLVSCRLGVVAPGTTGTATFTARLDPGYDGDAGGEVNRVVATTNTAPVDPASPPPATAPLPQPSGAPLADLSWFVSASLIPPATVLHPGDTFTHTVTAVNHGPSNASAVTITAPLPAGLDFAGSDDGCTVGTDRVVTCPVGDLSAGAAADRDYRVRLDPAYRGDGSDLRSTVSVSTATQQTTPDPTLPQDTTLVPPLAPATADLEWSKDVALAPGDAVLQPGDQFTYTVRIRNHGPSTAENVAITDPLPEGLRFAGSDDGCTALNHLVSCPVIPALAPADSPTAVTFTVQLDPAYRGTGEELGNRVIVLADTDEPNADPHPPPVAPTPVPLPVVPAPAPAPDGATVSVSVASSRNPSVFGEQVMFRVTVAATTPGNRPPTGTVELREGSVGALGPPVPLSDGTATFTTTGLAVGSRSVTAVYSGDDQYPRALSDPFTQSVDRGAVTLAMGATPNPAVYGQAVTITATVTPVLPAAGRPGGPVTVFDGPLPLGQATLTDRSVTFTVASLAVGSHTLRVEYGGDTAFTGATAELNQTVNRGATAVTVQSGPNPSSSGQPATFTAAVTTTGAAVGTPSGTVVFFDDTTPLGEPVAVNGGSASLTTAVRPPGEHRITAVYSGDGNLAGSTSTAHAHTVIAVPTATTLASSADPSVTGQPVTFTATVVADGDGAAAPTGVVDFLDGTVRLGSVPLAGATGVLAGVSGLAPGDHPVTAVYTGDDVHARSDSPAVVQTVEPGETVTAIAGLADPLVAGRPVDVPVQVTPAAPSAGAPTGTVEVLDGATTLGTAPLDATGTAVIPDVVLGAGEHALSASYRGDTWFRASTSPVELRTIGTVGSLVVLVPSVNPSVVGQPVTLQATVTPVEEGAPGATGMVEFFDGTTSLGTAPLDAAGQAVVSTDDLAIGEHPMTATFRGGGDTRGSSSSPVTVTVAPGAVDLRVTAPAERAEVGQPVPVAVRVAALPPAAGTPTGTVTVFEGPVSWGTVPLDEAGGATLAVGPLPVGLHQLTAVYSGDAGFAASTAPVDEVVERARTTTVVAADPNPSMAPLPMTITATVTSSTPDGSTPTGAVTFLRDGVAFGSAPLDGASRATLAVGEVADRPVTITAAYGGDATHEPSAFPEPGAGEGLVVGPEGAIAVAGAEEERGPDTDDGSPLWGWVLALIVVALLAGAGALAVARWRGRDKAG
jgi:large repetitive protein